MTDSIKAIKINVISRKELCAFFAKTFSMNVRPKLVTSKELQNIFTNIMTMFFSSPKHEIGWRKHEEYIYGYVEHAK